MSHPTSHKESLIPGRSYEIPYSEPGTPASHPTNVGFIGIGNMGSNIARNLAVYHATHKPGSINLVLFNRTREKADKFVIDVEEKLSALGGIISLKIADSVEELVDEADVVITSMAGDQAMTDLAHTIASAVKNAKAKHRIVVDMSTLYPATSGQIYDILSADHNTRYVACPVFGPPKTAKESKLIVCLAGDYASRKRVAYLLVPAIGKKVFDLGGNVEKVAAFKLLGNSYIVGTIELLSETHALAQKTGVGSQIFHELLHEMFPAPPIRNYSKRILEDDFDGSTGFNIDGGLKDVHHMQHLATEHQAPAPIIDLVHQHMLTAKALNAIQPSYKQNPNLDWSSLAAANRVAAGLEPFDSSKHRVGPIPDEES